MPSRRDAIRMTPDEIRDYLASSQTVIIVSNGHNGFPHPVPMHYWSDDQCRIYVETYEKSQKVKNFQRDPRATLLVETGKEYAELRSVMMYCDVKIINDKSFGKGILAKIMRKHPDPSMKIVETPEEMDKRLEYIVSKRVILEFTPQSFVSWDHTKLEGDFGPSGGKPGQRASYTSQSHGSAGADGDGDKLAHNKAVALKFMDAIAGERFDEIEEMMAPEFTWWSIGTTPASGVRQREEFIPLTRYLFDNSSGPLKFTYGEITAEGDRVCIEAWSNLPIKNGRTYSNTYHYLLKIRGDQIAGGKEFCDMMHVMDVLGEYM